MDNLKMVKTIQEFDNYAEGTIFELHETEWFVPYKMCKHGTKLFRTDGSAYLPRPKLRKLLDGNGKYGWLLVCPTEEKVRLVSPSQLARYCRWRNARNARRKKNLSYLHIRANML